LVTREKAWLGGSSVSGLCRDGTEWDGEVPYDAITFFEVGYAFANFVDFAGDVGATDVGVLL
jgi:hypothetical protein